MEIKLSGMIILKDVYLSLILILILILLLLIIIIIIILQSFDWLAVFHLELLQAILFIAKTSSSSVSGDLL